MEYMCHLYSISSKQVVTKYLGFLVAYHLSIPLENRSAVWKLIYTCIALLKECDL
jgi:hypothetical protein